jgi:hypothetical protein
MKSSKRLSDSISVDKETTCLIVSGLICLWISSPIRLTLPLQLGLSPVAWHESCPANYLGIY